MWRAHQEGRIGAMLALVHPDVVWRPLTSTGRSEYRGYQGTIQMLDDIRAAIGEYRMEFEELHQLPAGNVMGLGRVYRKVDGEEVAGPPVEALFGFRDGLVVSLDSLPGR